MHGAPYMLLIRHVKAWERKSLGPVAAPKGYECESGFCLAKGKNKKGLEVGPWNLVCKGG